MTRMSAWLCGARGCAGADASHAGFMGLNALHFVAERGDLEATEQVLAAKGGDAAAKAPNEDGMLPIHVRTVIVHTNGSHMHPPVCVQAVSMVVTVHALYASLLSSLGAHSWRLATVTRTS